MLELLNQLMPNIMSKPEALLEALIQTLQMLFISGGISLFFGIILGVTLVVTKKDGILENKIIWWCLDKFINLFRAVPFIILMFWLKPITLAIVGQTIDVKGAIIPLVFSTVPFMSRQIESALSEVNPGLIEAAQSMGDSPWELIFRVYLRESIPSIIRGTTITLISLIGLTAMAGAIGAGGLGNFALMYGYQRSQADVTNVVVILILLLITLIQSIGDFLIRKTSH